MPEWSSQAAREGRQETPQAWKVTAEEVKARGYNLVPAFARV